MTDNRRSKRAKPARRDALRARNRTAVSNAGTTLDDIVGGALGGHPAPLLMLASKAIDVAKPDAYTLIKRGGCEFPHLDGFLTGLIGARSRETSALLAVLAELLVDDSEAALRCRQELARRCEHLPGWIAALPQVDAYRAVRRRHVLGDTDELVIGARLDGYELTVAVLLDHNRASWIVDAGVVPEPIDEVLARVAESSCDTDVVEMSLADARMWIENGLRGPTFTSRTDCWPLYRALVQWLTSRLPEGGQSRMMILESAEEVCDRFFATDSAASFTDLGHRDLLLHLAENGSGDPLRWSATRVRNAMHEPLYGSDISLMVAMDAPDLLREFIPFVHAQIGICDELTSQTLAVLDELLVRFKRAG